MCGCISQVYRDSLYFPLNFAVNLKLLLKNNGLKIQKAVKSRIQKETCSQNSRVRNITRDKARHFIMLMESLHQEDIKILNIYMLNNRASKYMEWASLVAQWSRIRLPMQGTRVQALVWEDPTCRGATKPVSHNY